MTPAPGSHRLRQLLTVLAVLLTFEGLARKVAPIEYSIPIYLLKDVMVLIMAVYVLWMPMPPMLAFLWNAYKVLLVLFLPLVIATGVNDPLLAVFGAKQYLLYPMVGFATFLAFQNARKEAIVGFFRWIGLLLIPTVLVAFAELRLPHDHWLNQTVGGDTLEGFGAAGELRVSSTFSFVAQYCMFLNAQAFIIIIAMMDWRKMSILGKLVFPSLGVFLVLGSFITGSRGAVVGNTAIVALAGCLVLFKFQVRHLFQIIIVIAGLYLAVLAVNFSTPDATAAYSAREQGQLIGFSAEIRGRLFASYFALSQNRYLGSFFGNGLGVMSNGSNFLSDYAAKWRVRLWTETDFSTTLFEGGYYLVLIWYGFRIYVIVATTRRFLKGITGDYTVCGAFTQAFVIIIGAFGTLGFQPPTAIWWWMGVGTSVLFWWKCVGPPDPEIGIPGPPVIPPRKLVRGRSLYADVIHSRK